MPDPTPGQTCYEAYWRAFAPQVGPQYMHPWAEVHPQNQAAWEAAAEAARRPPSAATLQRPEAYACPTCGATRLIIGAQRTCYVTLHSAATETRVEREENDVWDFDDDAIVQCPACQGECTAREARDAWQTRQEDTPCADA